jgi:hypothetical protein
MLYEKRLAVQRGALMFILQNPEATGRIVLKAHARHG